MNDVYPLETSDPKNLLQQHQRQELFFDLFWKINSYSEKLEKSKIESTKPVTSIEYEINNYN